jgi:hypothetical protein
VKDDGMGKGTDDVWMRIRKKIGRRYQGVRMDGQGRASSVFNFVMS